MNSSIVFMICTYLVSTECQQCDDAFKDYLDCIADSVGDAQKGKALEHEFANDFANLATKSFDGVRSSDNLKCVLSRDELNTDVFGPEGPLRGCQTCMKIAADLRDKFFSATESVRKCLRDEFAAAVVDELQPCIQQRLNDFSFKVPPLPNFDRNTKTFLDIVLKAISYRIMAYSRLYVCGRAFPVRASATESLLKNKVGLYPLHCDLNRSCRSKIRRTCASKFEQVKSATCACMLSKRNAWHEKFDQVRNTIENFSTSSSCSAGIKNAVGIWRYKLQNAMKTCVPAKENFFASISIDKAIDKACDDVQRLDVSGKAQVLTALRMVTIRSDCDSTFKGYLDCIAATTGDAKKGKVLETEFANDFAKLVARSFDDSNTGSNDKCILSQSELGTDILGPIGPLRGCDDCQKYATEIRNQFFNASEDVRKCLRLEFAAAVVNEMQPCIGTKLNDNTFKIPELPDFDREAQYFLDVIYKAVSYRVMANSRLSVCSSFNPERAKKTSKLLKDKSGLFKLHCDLNKSCRSKVSSDCSTKFDKVKGATCDCMFEKRDEWHNKFDKVKSTIENYSSPGDCSAGIKEAVGGWRYMLQNSMRKCIPAKKNIFATITIDQAIDDACRSIQNKSDSERKQILIAIRMIRNLLDALNDRITRFCEVQC